MRLIAFVLLLVFSGIDLSAQHDAYGNDWHPGTYTDAAGNEHEGELRIMLLQRTKLRFRPETSEEELKLGFDEVVSFTIGEEAEFVRLRDVPAFTALGGAQTLKHSFGRVLQRGDVDAYVIYVSVHNPVSQAAEILPHLILHKNGSMVAVPMEMRVRKKKFEKIRQALLDWLDANEVTRSRDVAAASVRENGFLDVYAEWL